MLPYVVYSPTLHENIDISHFCGVENFIFSLYFWEIFLQKILNSHGFSKDILTKITTTGIHVYQMWADTMKRNTERRAQYDRETKLKAHSPFKHVFNTVTLSLSHSFFGKKLRRRLKNEGISCWLPPDMLRTNTIKLWF